LPAELGQGEGKISPGRRDIEDAGAGCKDFGEKPAGFAAAVVVGVGVAMVGDLAKTLASWGRVGLVSWWIERSALDAI
jgi:hypothetical protein